MIKSVIIKNFQSHKDTELTFVPGINCIVGNSDSGKSAFLRSLYWAIENRPEGIAFCSHWNRDEKGNPENPVLVKIAYDNLKGVIRERGPEFNGYIIMCGEPNYTQLEALRGSVPEEVSNILNLSEVNVQKQLSAPFMLSASAGEVARFFNSTIKLEDIDKSLSAGDSLKRSTNLDLRTVEIQKVEVEKNLEKYEWVENALCTASKLNRIDERLKKVILEAETRQECLKNSISIRRFLEKYRNLEAAKIKELELSKMQGELADLLDKSYALVKLFADFSAAKKKLTGLQHISEAVKKEAELKRTAENLETISELHSDIQATSNKIWITQAALSQLPDTKKAEKLSRNVQGILEELKNHQKKEEELSKIQSEYRKILVGIPIYLNKIEKYKAELPANCPFCGKPLEESNAY